MAGKFLLTGLVKRRRGEYIRAYTLPENAQVTIFDYTLGAKQPLKVTLSVCLMCSLSAYRSSEHLLDTRTKKCFFFLRRHFRLAAVTFGQDAF